MNLDSVKQTFIIESNELLEQMEQALLQLEKDPENQDAVHAVFRAAHTIKGSSGMFGYTGIVEFTHVLESFLEDLRKGKFSVNSEIIAILLGSGDHIKELINLYINDDKAEVNSDLKSTGDELLEKLPHSAVSKTSTEEKSEDASQSKPAISGEISSQENWHISIRFSPEVLRHGMDPLSFINYLAGMGKIENLCTITDNLPLAGEIDVERCYLGFEINFQTSSTKEEIESVFEFLHEDAVVIIIPPHSDLIEFANLLERVPESTERMRHLLLEIGALQENEWEKVMLYNGSEPEENQMPKGSSMADLAMSKEDIEQKTSQESAAQPVVEPKNGSPNTQGQQTVSDTTAKFIRMDASKLDDLINLVGELVIGVSNIRQLSEDNGDKGIIEASLTMGRLVEEVRDSAMNVRMVQIGDTFRRFERVVRDLSQKMGKEIELKVKGGETELDKTVVEKISDPLMHLIRNAIDHGISTPDERVQQGKSRKGLILVNAYHDTGNIVIEIKDDGVGLNKDLLLEKGIEKGLLLSGVEYTDDDIYKIILQPGFSTAKVVTDVSGRGVGMDVVKKNIEALRGTVDIESVAGKGTTMRIHLPLTLAIIDGFLVEIGSSSFVIPLDMVLECINMSEEDEMSSEGGHFVNLRGEVLPYLRMKEFFHDDSIERDLKNENIIVVKYGQQKAGLVVDKLLGEFQTVIKPLGKMFSNVQGISGATILGNGNVALILDIPRLIRFAQKLEASHMSHAHADE